MSSRAAHWGRAGEVPFIPQLTPTDCAAASLASVLAFHDKHLPIHEVRGVLGGGRNGANAKQLVAAARSFGLHARGVHVEPNKLRLLPRGSVLHWELRHFVVFESCTETMVQVVDPAAGRRLLPMTQVAKALSGVAIVFEPSEDFVASKPKRRNRWKRYVAWMLGVRGVWGRVLATSFFLQVLALAGPGFMTVLVDKVVPRADLPLLELVAAGLVTTTSFYFLSTLLRARLLLELRSRVESRMSLDFVDHLLALPYAFFQARTTGDLMMRMSSQTAIRELLTTGTLSALLDGALVGLYFLLLLGAAPMLALVAVVLALLQLVTYLVAARRNTQLVTEGLAAQSRLEGYQVEMLSGIETLKAMGATDRSMSRWNDLYVESLNRVIARGRLDGTFQAFLGTLRFMGPIVLMLAGAQKVLEGSLSLGTMLGLSALGSGFLEPVANLVGTGLKLTQLNGYMERIEDVLETPRETSRRVPVRQADRSQKLRGAIRVEHLSFKYPSETGRAEDDVSFEIAPGECVAIVGASGSGKSTLARLVAGLYEAESGSVRFDGRDLPSWDLSLLRDRLGVVTQDTRLFSGTIRDNVSMFDPSLDPEELDRACKLACLDDVVARMPMGYDTMLADGGSSLSGGQRQRVSLARALARRPDVLILDEATSALDTVSERSIQENLRRLSCTRIVVAHRLSTIVEADKIIVLDAGRVVAMGRHEMLLAASDTYRNLARAQGDAASPAQKFSHYAKRPPPLVQRIARKD
jgi:ATP-binding cassette subfamily B protein